MVPGQCKGLLHNLWIQWYFCGIMNDCTDNHAIPLNYPKGFLVFWVRWDSFGSKWLGLTTAFMSGLTLYHISDDQGFLTADSSSYVVGLWSSKLSGTESGSVISGELSLSYCGSWETTLKIALVLVYCPRLGVLHRVNPFIVLSHTVSNGEQCHRNVISSNVAGYIKC